jgi:hypothetical protein
MIDMFVFSSVFFVWCLLVLGIVFSLFAIFFVQGMTLYLQGDHEIHPDQKRDVLKYFGSVKITMMSLFMAATGGDDWSLYHNILSKASSLYSALWFFFIAVSFIALFNIIGGCFCQKAVDLARPSVHDRMIEKRAKDEQEAGELSQLLQNSCRGRSLKYHMNMESFEDFLEEPEVITYFEGRGLGPTSVRRLFQLLVEAEQSENIPFGKFISAVIRLEGAASSIDLHVLRLEMMRFRKAVQDQLGQAVIGRSSGHRPRASTLN